MSISDSNKKFYVISSTEGCATNLQENNSYRKDYTNQGMIAAQNAETADVILINTCAYSQQMEDRSTDMITEYKSKYPNANVVVAGCLPKINPKKMKTEFEGTPLRSLPESLDFADQFDRSDFELLSDKHRLVVKLRPLYFWIESKIGIKFNPLHNIFKTVVVNEDFHLVTASTGCLGKCTFCAIKRAKGSLKSRPLPTILSDFENGLKKNKKLFWILGDDIGCWGLDIKSNISELLLGVTTLNAQYEVVLNYFDPHYLKNNTEALIKLLSSEKIVGLNMPIQSGNQRILNEMQRHYDLNFVFNTLEKIKSRNKKIAIKTNIIVGFPGESWSEFFDSVYSVRHFDAILALKFTPRPMTPANTMENQIPESVKLIRMALMNLAITFRHIYVAVSSFLRISR
ncbi:radical SAM protein [bacterium]|nr:radical SAM protein [bacterium]